MGWTAADIPSLTGKVALVTGANSGLGFESARALARRGAHVIMGCRDAGRAERAAAGIRAETPSASLEFLRLDLMSLRSVEGAARSVLSRGTRLDLLLNNAGIMAMPYTRTEDGFESQFGTNHLAHFALTAQLFPLLATTPGARVVSVSSIVHWMGKLRFDDLAWDRGYSKWPAYGMSKLANLLFTYELARRCAERGVQVSAVAAHPGYSSTHLETRQAEVTGAGLKLALIRFYNPLVAQHASQGALPQLYAATAPDVQSGSYYGPRWFEIWGAPKRVRSSGRSRDLEAMQALWQRSEELTGARFRELEPLAVRASSALSASPA
jgi:NAD(P)-dependent dehydrogenase (short-subunit alcohol dehydrogenase family)